MTHSFQSNRKQKRNDCEEFENCIPSPKRAKLKNFCESQNVDSNFGHSPFHIPNAASQVTIPNKDGVPGERSNLMSVNHQREVSQYNALQTDIYHVTEEHMQHMNLKYSPDLNASENPHYYENNRLLFELYVERTHRTSFHPQNSSHT